MKDRKKYDQAPDYMSYQLQTIETSHFSLD